MREKRKKGRTSRKTNNRVKRMPAPEQVRASKREENPQKGDAQKKGTQKFTITMQKKLVVLFILVLLAFAGLSIRVMLVSRENENDYKKQVLSQLEYDSKTLPYRRGSILDCNGTSLAVSEKVYNLVIDCKVILSKETYFEPTMQALAAAFPELNMEEVRKHVKEHPTSSYYVPIKQMSYSQVSAFETLKADENNKNRKLIKGIWFEEEYKRMYPNNTLASDVIGFTTSDNVGMYGLEEYYDTILNGTTGREYGYLNNDSNLERTTKPAVDGYNLITTIDANIQKIVEEKLNDYNEEYKNNVREGHGANNVGCIIMEVDTGKVLAMASYPNFDLNKPFDLSAYYTEEQIAGFKENDTYYDVLNELWKNYCISVSYEPGSTFKPFTVAMGLENGIIKDSDTFECKGVLTVGGHDIKCNNKKGHGIITTGQAVEYSCNVALMKMAASLGPKVFSKGQNLFNFGLKTNIDLAGEFRTVDLVFDENMGSSDLATNSFGQNFNCTMIQMITGFCSLINGGYYYEPHMVSRIETSSGAVVQNIEPRVLKQTVSASTSDLIIDYCNLVVSGGSGKTARPAGYAIGGKTGTAQTYPRGNDEYVVSFLGYAPADNPQIAIYVVVDRANVEEQANSRLATKIVREVLTEVLPYLHIYMTEELSEDEVQELAQRQLENTLKYSTPKAPVSGGDAGGTGGAQMPWESYQKNEDGYYIDPETGKLLDPDTGNPIEDGYNDIYGAIPSE